jgi:hypothetical protein
MSEAIRIRLYNVRFGDAILVTVPDEDEDGNDLDRHLLIDVGNVLTGDGGDDAVYRDILEDIRETVGSHGIDLYVMTHEHMDHVQGLLHGATKLTPPVTLPIDTVWLTRSADPVYYEIFDDAKKALDRTAGVFDELERYLAASGDEDKTLRIMLDNNNPRRTADCVGFLRGELTTPDKVHYVHREFDTSQAGVHPFRRASFEIWAPEEDTSIYYGRFKPMAFGDAPDNADAAADGPGQPVPPAGVDATAFFDLVTARANGAHANALAIDKAKNNSSVVFTLTWNDRVLLFSGDAEIRSWRTMNKLHNDPEIPFHMEPVDFIKVSHHGSHNGTPDDDILDIILPRDNPRPGSRVAGVSTCKDTYNNVPDSHTSERLLERVDELVTTESDEPFQDIVIG